MSDRFAWDDHTLDVEQLDLFACTHDQIDESAGLPEETRVYQLTELPGESFEDIFEDGS